MKNFYIENRLITIILLAISLTFWGAIFALPILGLWQISLIIYFWSKRSYLSKHNKNLVFGYTATTFGLIIFFKLLSHLKGVEMTMLLFVWMFISALLALIHLYITYRIKKQN